MPLADVSDNGEWWVLTYIHLRNTGAKKALNASTLICFSAPVCWNITGWDLEGVFSANRWGSQAVWVNKPRAPGPASHWPLEAAERSRGEGRTAGTENSFPLGHGWSCPKALPWCSLPAALQRCQISAKKHNTSSAYKKKFREDSTWFDLIQSLCALLTLGVGRAKVTGVAHPCPHPKPKHPALQRHEWVFF